jgi:hypothetical protein
MKTLARALMILACGCVAADEPVTQTWPEISQTARPWTRWWWPGSAVEREPLAAQLREFAAAGIGGVEITPIYGARGGEKRDVEFLSSRWAELLSFTTGEARRLGLGVDMATGTGWPFGGPEVSVAQGSSTLALIDGRLAGKPTAMKVKRAAPGGAGLVLDPYSTDALDSYLGRFTAALQGLPAGSLRGQFHDSFEYYNASWSPTLPQEFLALNGYDVQAHARELLGEVPLDADKLGRLKGDYRRTLAKMHLEYVRAWVSWSHARGFNARNQAHGAPGNLLDLYAAADIPETESYGMTPLPIPGFRAEADNVNPDPDPIENLIARFASSAAHVSGRPLASSETLTWLRENFREAPWAAKPQIDRLFAAGINHIFYHGASYTPADVPWPGWYFYASTQLNPNNPLWRDYAAMNAYVARVQSLLQSGRPDNDVLIYWPFDDLVDDPEGLMRQLGVHENKWLIESSAGRLAIELLHAGYGFDFISDAQIAQLRVEGGALVAPGGRYRALVIPRLRRISASTLASLSLLVGAPLIAEAVPEDVPGLGQLETRREKFVKTLADMHWADRVVRANVSAALQELGIVPEPASRLPLGNLRRARDDGYDYFFVNHGASAFDGWLQLATPAAAALIMDPLSERTGVAALRAGEQGRPRVYLQLASGESIILRTYRKKPQRRGLPAWQYTARAGEGQALAGEWQVEFLTAGLKLPAPFEPPAPVRLPALRSWTELDDPALASFAGTARYRIEFDAPAKRAAAWLLDLGDVREAARVRLNGEPAGHAWSLPFTLRLPGNLRPKGNLLEIEVTNLPANRIRDLDLRKVDWKVMKEINLVTLRYKPFDASGWQPAPSGLLGPVRLVPLEVVRPR